jgi:dienelactone hydrolase
MGHHRLSFSVLLCATLFAGWALAAATEIPWDLAALSLPPATRPAPEFQEQGVQALFFDGVPWQGRPTRVFAWYGAPEGASADAKVPAMVLVHGGGGTAFAEWVRLWTGRGYAAIAMDTCGCVPKGEYGKWERHEHGGPSGWGGLDQIDAPLTDQWSYHAVASVILAHSLIRSFPEVDADRIGLTGISWGGYLTCIAAGVDHRFRFAAPVYGCGFLGEDSAWVEPLAKLPKEKAQRWLEHWDPSVYLPGATLPMLWVTGTNDFAFPMNSLQKSYRLPRGPRTLAIRLRMPHAHGGAGENPEEIHAFANHLCRQAPALPRIVSQGREDGEAWVTFEASRAVSNAELLYTRDAGPWKDRYWEAMPAALDAQGRRASARIPEGVRVYYFNLLDDQGCIVSSEHEEMAAPESLPGAEQAIHLTTMRWDPVELAFDSATPHENPFRVDFRAVLTAPDGSTRAVPGFFDGAGRWKLRVSLDQPGAWHLRTASDDTALNDRTARLHCHAQPPPGQHGPLRVDPAHPHHFVHADGTRFFHLGYECDWLWALDLGRTNLQRTRAFLNLLDRYGFNVVMLNVYAHDTAWRRGHSEEQDFGPPALYPWAGSNDQPDHGRLNLAFWQHYDRVIRALYERGLQAHIMIKVYNKFVQWPEKDSPEEDLYLRTLVARYAAFPNVLWDFSKEAFKESDTAYKLRFLARLRDLDPFDRLRTSHDDDDAYDRGDYDALLHYQSDQQHEAWHATVLRQRARRAWPVVNVEYGYEQGPGGAEDKTYPVAQSADEVTRRAWRIAMAGGYGVYYYTRTAWDILHPEDTPPGYTQQQRLRAFFEQIRYWEFEPRSGTGENGLCLARDDAEYVFLVEDAEALRCTLPEGLPALRGQWFNPFTGATAEAGTVHGGEQCLAIPAAWREGAAVLWLRP